MSQSRIAFVDAATGCGWYGAVWLYNAASCGKVAWNALTLSQIDAVRSGLAFKNSEIPSAMTDSEYERRLKALQQEVSASYLKGYEEARQRSQWTISAAVDESNRLRLALEEALVGADETTKTRILAAMQRRT